MALEVGVNFSPCDGLSLVSTTRLHPTLAEAFGNGNALKEVSQADGARDWAKLKIHMFLTWPYSEMWKIARAVHQLCFFQPQCVLSDCMSFQRCIKLSWKCRNNWDTRQRTGPASLVSHSCHAWPCWCCCKAYWAQIQGQAEPCISIAFGCQNAFSPSEGKRRTPVVSLPVSYCVSD